MLSGSMRCCLSWCLLVGGGFMEGINGGRTGPFWIGLRVFRLEGMAVL